MPVLRKARAGEGRWDVSASRRVSIEAGSDARIFSHSYDGPLKIYVNDDLVYESEAVRNAPARTCGTCAYENEHRDIEPCASCEDQKNWTPKGAV
jgi:hypothetical protein